jgi:hypothetical protein
LLQAKVGNLGLLCEVTLPDIKRHWPHHVALPAAKVRGMVNSEIVWSFAGTLSAAPRPYAVHNDSGSSENDCSRRGDDGRPASS